MAEQLPPEEAELLRYNEESILQQIEATPFTLGYYKLRFFTENGKPVNRITGTIGDFYLYPSGGTLRDSTFNIVFYDSRFDIYRGFVPPHRRQK